MLLGNHNQLFLFVCTAERVVYNYSLNCLPFVTHFCGQLLLPGSRLEPW